jgi:hypothetical protein
MDLMIMVQSNKVRSLMRELRQEIENAEQYYDDLSGCPELRERAFFNFVNVFGPINGWPDPVNVLMSRVLYGVQRAIVQPCRCPDPGHDHQQELDEAERIAKDVVRDVAAALTGCEIEFGNKISSAFHSYGPDYEVLAEEYEERVNNRNNW